MCKDGSMILFILACQSSSQDTALFDSWIYSEETSQRLVLADGFVLPKDLTPDDDSMLLVDQEEGTIIRVESDGTTERIDNNLGAPSLLATNGTAIIVYDSENQQLLEVNEGSHTDFTGDDDNIVANDLLLVNNTVYWIDTQSGSLYKQGLQENTSSLVLEYLASPTGLVCIQRT